MVWGLGCGVSKTTKLEIVVVSYSSMPNQHKIKNVSLKCKTRFFFVLFHFIVCKYMY